LMFLRSWAGYYAITPDHSHILGREPAWPENLYVATGFSGHGLMMAPLTGELIAKNILNDEVDELMKPFLPTRFKEGTLLHETMKIG
jgi:sarcosine oxidase subunit beta